MLEKFKRKKKISENWKFKLGKTTLIGSFKLMFKSFVVLGALYGIVIVIIPYLVTGSMFGASKGYEDIMYDFVYVLGDFDAWEKLSELNEYVAGNPEKGMDGRHVLGSSERMFGLMGLIAGSFVTTFFFLKKFKLRKTQKCLNVVMKYPSYKKLCYERFKGGIWVSLGSTIAEGCIIGIMIAGSVQLAISGFISMWFVWFGGIFGLIVTYKARATY